MSDLHDTVVSSLRSYFSFLLKTLPRLASPKEADTPYINDPPSSGWPEVNSDSLAILKKTEGVIDILKHLPHFSDPDMEGHNVVAPGPTHMINCGGSDMTWALDRARKIGRLEGLLEPSGAGILPAHVVALTQSGSNGSWWLLDTEQGERQ